MSRHSKLDRDDLVSADDSTSEPDPSASDFDWNQDLAGTAQNAVDVAGTLRDQVGHLSEDITGTHREAFATSLRARSNTKSRKSAIELLSSLSDDRGFGWASIADLLQISVPALRKWRKSGGVSGPNRARLNQLSAFFDTLSQYAIDDVAAWMDTPVLPRDFYITPRWLYARYDDAPVALLEYAAQAGMDPHMLLDFLDPTLRSTAARVEHDLVVEVDGSVSIHRT